MPSSKLYSVTLHTAVVPTSSKQQRTNFNGPRVERRARACKGTGEQQLRPIKKLTYHCRHFEILLDAHLDPGSPLAKCGLLLDLLLIHLRVSCKGTEMKTGIDRETRPTYRT